MKRGTLLLTALMISGMLTACGNGDSKTTTAASVQETASEAVTTAAETSAEVETTEAETEASAIPLGETATLKDWNISVTNMQMLDSVDNGYGSFAPDEGNKYMLVTANVENAGKTAETFLPLFGMNDDVSVIVLYGDGYEFSLTQLLGYQKDLINSTINPLSAKEGDMAFEVPNSVAESAEPIVIEFKAGNEKVTFSLRQI